MVTQDEFRKAGERAKELEAQTPRAVSVKYDRLARQIVIELSSKLGIFFSPENAEGLETATPEQLSEVEITPSGYGLHFPRLDADLYLPGLLAGMFGSENWTAARMGSRGGRAKSSAKTLAARENGQKGGRPKRVEIGRDERA